MPKSHRHWTDRQAADRQAGRQADRQAGRPTGRQTSGQTDRQAGRQAGRPTDRQTGRQTSGQTDRQAGRQTDRQTERDVPYSWWRAWRGGRHWPRHWVLGRPGRKTSRRPRLCGSAGCQPLRHRGHKTTHITRTLRVELSNGDAKQHTSRAPRAKLSNRDTKQRTSRAVSLRELRPQHSQSLRCRERFAETKMQATVICYFVKFLSSFYPFMWRCRRWTRRASLSLSLSLSLCLSV